MKTNINYTHSTTLALISNIHTFYKDKCIIKWVCRGLVENKVTQDTNSVIINNEITNNNKQ